MDWKALLEKYMALVAECEGVTFVSHASTGVAIGFRDGPMFTEAELDALRQVHVTVCGKEPW